MCDPLTIAATAATVGSTFAKMNAANDAAEAREDVLTAENIRQQGFRNQGAAQFNQTLEGFDRDRQQGDQQRVRQDRRQDLQGAADSAPGEATPVSASAPKAVGDEAARKLADALTEGRQFATKLADAGAFGELQFGNRINLGRSRDELQTIAGNAAGSLNPLELELAAAAEEGRSPLGDILAATGSVLGLAGATGVGDNIFGGGIDFGKTAGAADSIGRRVLKRPIDHSAPIMLGT